MPLCTVLWTSSSLSDDSNCALIDGADAVQCPRVALLFIDELSLALDCVDNPRIYRNCDIVGSDDCFVSENLDCLPSAKLWV